MFLYKKTRFCYVHIVSGTIITWKEAYLGGGRWTCERWQEKIELIKLIPSQLGFSFDLSPLAQKNGYYIVNTTEYSFYINICGSVPDELCHTKSAACQVTHGWVTLVLLSVIKGLLLHDVLSVCNSEKFACKVITVLLVIDSGNLHARYYLVLQ